MTRTIYGIKQCDTVRRALKDLDHARIDYDFHDLRADGLDEATVQAWVDALGIDTVLNRRGTTWRQLKQDVSPEADNPTLIQLMLAHPTLVKRPVFDHDGQYRIGYTAKTAASTLHWFTGTSA